MKESVALVNEQDQMYGTMDKLAAHRKGLLHRAISVFIFNSEGYLLLQQRAPGKYHSGGLWSNTCCSHPRLGERPMDAAHRRLKEEMGIEAELSASFSFVYYVELDNGFIENEFDHVFIGISDTPPDPNPAEASDTRCMSINELTFEIETFPEKYSFWLKSCFEEVKKHYEQLSLSKTLI